MGLKPPSAFLSFGKVCPEFLTDGGGGVAGDGGNV